MEKAVLNNLNSYFSLKWRELFFILNRQEVRVAINIHCYLFIVIFTCDLELKLSVISRNYLGNTEHIINVLRYLFLISKYFRMRVVAVSCSLKAKEYVCVWIRFFKFGNWIFSWKALSIIVPFYRAFVIQEVKMSLAPTFLGLIIHLPGIIDIKSLSINLVYDKLRWRIYFGCWHSFYFGVSHLRFRKHLANCASMCLYTAGEHEPTLQCILFYVSYSKLKLLTHYHVLLIDIVHVHFVTSQLDVVCLTIFFKGNCSMREYFCTSWRP